MEYVIGVDFGGGSSKATLLSGEGKVIAKSKSEYKTIYGDGGKVEQDPNDWVYTSCKNIKNLIQGINKEDIKCICFDAATHTAVLMDENFNTVRNSVYWTDTRSIEQVKRLKRDFSDDIFKKFKHTVDTIWTLPELLWIKENEPDIWARVKKITFAKDFVRHSFSDDFVTDKIEAEGSMFFPFDEYKWEKRYLDILGINEDCLPKIVSPLTIVGNVKKEIADKLGLSYNTKVICGSTDTAMEVFAAGAIEKGQTTIKLATAGRICVVDDKTVADKHIINYSHLIDGLFYPGTATKACASSLHWFRDTFGGNYSEFDELVRKVPIGCDGLIYHPYLNGELTPYGNPKLRGSFVGISGTCTKGHFARAIMEGVAMSLIDCKKHLIKNGVKMQTAFAIGGGSTSKEWRQIVSDALNIKLVTTENNDSSFGSAMCAGIASGIFKDYSDAIKTCSEIVSETTPNCENTEKYEKIFERYKKIQKALEEIYNA